jgi:hypothetical protein
MQILTVENEPYSLNNLPDEIDDVRYCVLDVTDPTFIDYYFLPLIFLESFSSPAVVLQIGEFQIQMPLDWNILVGDPGQGMLEVLPLTNLNDRGFETLLYNPLKGYMPNWAPVQIVNVFVELKWYFPKLKFGHLLAMPLQNKFNPLCAFFIKETNKIPDQIDIGDVIT